MYKDTKQALTAIDGNIANWLKRHGMTNAEFAKKLGISIGSLNNKRNQTTEWTLSEIMSLIEIIEVDFEQLIS